MNVFLVLSFCLAVCYSAKGSKAPFIEPCREGDSKCLLRSAKAALPIISAGVPSLGIGSLDPLHLDHVETDNAGLHMEFKDTTIKGLSKSEVTKLDFFNKFGFPGCLGCIDGTHVALIKPMEHKERFFNHKQ